MILAAIALAVPILAYADDSIEITGVPLVLDSDTIMVGGQTLSLWGIVTLAGDQQCWHDQSSWPCGEQATMTLKHFIENRSITCNVKDKSENGNLHAQCFRQRGPHEIDVGRFLIKHGWAMDYPEESSGYYQQDQQDACSKRRGIWTSRFQTAADWREGIQRFVDYDRLMPEEHAATALSNTSTASSAVNKTK